MTTRQNFNKVKGHKGEIIMINSIDEYNILFSFGRTESKIKIWDLQNLTCLQIINVDISNLSSEIKTLLYLPLKHFLL